MARHLLRDYVVQTASSSSEAHAYILAIFLRRVLDYTSVGQTNFNIETVGTYLLASGTTSGNRAGINFGTGATYEVSIPSGVRAVTSGDIGRLLVLKSTANPLSNSGVYLITGVNTGSNRYVVDYRSGDSPPAEAADTMNWWLYASDANRPVAGTANSNTNQYRGSGTSTTPRIILQSPHASGWQVRICLETAIDYSTASNTNLWTAAPGFGGDANGDFSTGGRHLHGAQYWNTSTGAGTNGVASIGGGSQVSAGWRITIEGDDTGQAVVLVARKTTGLGNSNLVVFGIPDNEPSPLPSSDAVHRLFVWGASNPGNSGQYSNNITYSPGNYTSGLGQGLAWSLGGTLISCVPSTWVYIYSAASPFTDATGSDSPWNNATELFSVEVMTGAVANWPSTFSFNSTQILMPFEVRSLGTFPYLRHGRTNFSTFTVTSDAGKVWQHLQNGVYLQWGGPALIP